MKTINTIFELIAELFLVVAVILCDVMWAKCALVGAFLLLVSIGGGIDMIKKYTMDVYPRTLYVAINESDESILKFLNGNDGDTIYPMEESSNAYEMSVTDGTDGGALVRFRDLSKVTQGIVAHESFHAAM